jgi:hypothetical protein
VERTESVGEVKIMRMQEMLQVETLDESRIPESPPTPSTTPAPSPTADDEKDLVPTVWVDEAGNESEVGALDPMICKYIDELVVGSGMGLFLIVGYLPIILPQNSKGPS